MLSEMLQTGIADSVIFTLLATSWLLVFRVTGVVHLAHGTAYLLGGYVGYQLFSSSDIVLAAIGSIGGAAVFGLLCEFLVYAPLARRGAPSWIQVISGLALFVLGENLIGLAFGSNSATINSSLGHTIDIAGAEIKRVHLIFLAAAALWLGGLALILQRTRAGLYFRAVSSDQRLAELAGVPTPRVRLMAFALASAVAGLAGLLRMLDVGADSSMDFNGILFAFVPAIVAGGRSYIATVAVSVFMAIVADIVGEAWGGQWVLLGVFGCLAVAVLARPAVRRLAVLQPVLSRYRLRET